MLNGPKKQIRNWKLQSKRLSKDFSVINKKIESLNQFHRFYLFI